MEHAFSVGPTGFSNMQRAQPDTALRGLRVDGWQVLVLEVLHDLLGQLCQHSFGQGLLGGLQAKGSKHRRKHGCRGPTEKTRLGCPQLQTGISFNTPQSLPAASILYTWDYYILYFTFPPGANALVGRNKTSSVG